MRGRQGNSDAPRWVGPLLVAFSAASALAHVLSVRPTTSMRTDSAEYLRRVQRCLNGEWFFDTVELGHPLYVAWCAAVHVVRGGGNAAESILWSGQVAGILLSASGVIPAYWLGRSLLASWPSGVLVGILYGVAPVSLWWAGELMSDAAAMGVAMWAAGCLARWSDRGGCWWLAGAAIAIGVAILFRVSTVLLLPAFVYLWWLGAYRHRRWFSVGYGLLAAVVVVACAALHRATFASDRPLASYFQRSSLNAVLDWGLLTSADGAGIVLRDARHGFGDVWLAVAAVGLVLAAVCNRRFLLLAVLWSVPLLVLPTVNRNTPFQIRFLVPLVPIVALGLALVVRVVGRRAGPLPAAAGALGLIAVAAWHAGPDLVCLRTRDHVGHAVGAWYGRHAPARSLLLVGDDLVSVQVLAPTCEPYLVSRQQYGRWPEPRARSGPAAMLMVRRSLVHHVPVYFSDYLAPGVARALHAAYEVDRVHSFPAHAIRNQHDPIMRRLGEPMHRSSDVGVYRIVRRKPDAVRPLPAASVERVGRGLTLRRQLLDGQGRRVAIALAAHPAALDWTRRRSFKRDRFREARHEGKPVRLDADGKFTARVLDRGGAGWLAYGLLDESGTLIAASVPQRL